MSNLVFHPVQVVLKLKEEQKKEVNKWYCTINEELRIVTSDRVTYVCTNHKTAANSFNPKEVESYCIYQGNVIVNLL